jgi:hypothetical protein
VAKVRKIMMLDAGSWVLGLWSADCGLLTADC